SSSTTGWSGCSPSQAQHPTPAAFLLAKLYGSLAAGAGKPHLSTTWIRWIVMSGHSKSSDTCRTVCDTVWAEFKKHVPEIVRSEKQVPCAFHHPKRSRFAYLYHSADSAIIFFRGNHNDEASIFPQRFGIKKRKKLDGNWQRQFPFSMSVRGA